MTAPEQPTTTLAARVLARIARDHIVPRPRWEFIFKNYFFWTLGALAVALGAFAFSAALFEVENAGWRLAVATHPDFLTFLLSAAPFLWALALALFVLIGYANIRRTNRGYRYPLALIAFGAVITSVALGSALYAFGLGGELEEAVGDHPPFYRPILVAERSWWLAPERGLLGGSVVSVAPGISSFTLRDFAGGVWRVDGSDLSAPDLTVVARGGIVRVVGVPAAATSSVFHACFVFPWEIRGAQPEPVPSPLAAISSTSERSAPAARSEECKGIRPYQQLRTLEEAGL